MKKRQLLSCYAAAGLVLGTGAIGTAQEAVPAGEVVTVASTASEALNDLHASQWVQARPSGELIGRVVRLQNEAVIPAPGMRVAVVRDGQIVSEAQSTPEGGFILNGVVPGRYTIVARGTQAIGAFSLAVLDPQAGRHLPAEVGLPVVSVPAEAVATMLGGQLAPAASSTVAATFTSAPSGDPLGENRHTTTQNYNVALQADGTLLGQVSRTGMAPAASDLVGVNVMIYENGREIARTQTDANGAFAIGNMVPGCYGFVANGRSGFAAVGFCAVSTQETLSMSGNARGERFVALAAQPGNTPGALNVELGDSTAVQVIEEYVLEPIPEDDLLVGPPPFAGPPGFGAPGAGGGFGGGGAGGGGGIFGGRFGGLAALGALGGIAAAIAASDDEDDFVNPPTATPQVVSDDLD